MSERSLGIEVTPSRIMVVEMDASTNPPKVFNFASVDLFSSHPDNISQQTLSILSHMGTRIKKARVAIEDAIAHHVVSLPPMPKKEMKVVVEREMRDALGPLQGGEMVMGWEILGDDERGKKIVLITAVSSSMVREKALLLQEIGLSPDVITTVPLALLNSLKLIQGADQGASSLVHFGESKAHAVFMRDGKWAFYRELTGSEGRSEEVLTEMNRSLLYFRHQFRGEEVERIFLSGKGVEGLEESWSETLGVKVERFCPTLDLSPLGGRAEEFRHVFHEFAIPIGLAGRRARDCIHLPDPEMARRIRKEVIKKGVVMGIIICTLVLGGAYWWLSQVVSNEKRFLLKKKQELNVLEPYLTAQEARAVYGKNRALLREIDDHALWAEALRELSLLVPSEMAFRSLKFNRENGKITMSIKGQILASQAVAGQEIFSQFYAQLKSSPLFTNMEVDPASIKVIRPKADDKSSPVKVEFEVKGELASVEIEYEKH